MTAHAVGRERAGGVFSISRFGLVVETAVYTRGVVWVRGGGRGGKACPARAAGAFFDFAFGYGDVLDDSAFLPT